MTREYRLAYLVSHPIQYQAPMLRAIAADNSIDLTVYFLSDFSVREYLDVGFGTRVTWDVPLLDGYRYEFLPAFGGTQKLTAVRPWSRGLRSRLRAGHYDALWLHGYTHQVNLRAFLAARSLGIKVMIRSDVQIMTAARTNANRRIKEMALRWLFARTDAFLAVGSLNREYYLRYGAAQEQIFSMPYCVDNARFQADVAASRPYREQLRAELEFRPGRPVILFASKFQPLKRAEDLFEAYCRLSPDGKREPEPYLLYIGDGARRAALEEKARATGWSSIRFLGFKAQPELPRYYDLCDVFVLVSDKDAWALVVNEVMNACKPVIVSDHVGAFPDLVREGENGYVVPVGDIGALHKRLKTLTANQDLAREMGRRSREIIDTWSFREDVAGIKKALETVVGGDRNL